LAFRYPQAPPHPPIDDDAIAKDVVAIDDHIAEVDADRKADAVAFGSM
jgi:hypothetical protein